MIRGSFPQATHDVFHHDDGVIDDESHGGGHSPQCHDVEAHLAYIKEQNGGRQHARHRDGGDQCDLEVAQKKQEDQDRENNAY